MTNFFNLIEKLGVLNYIIFLYSEDFYYPYIEDDVMNKCLSVVAIMPLTYADNMNKANAIQDSIKVFSLVPLEAPNMHSPAG